MRGVAEPDRRLVERRGCRPSRRCRSPGRTRPGSRRPTPVVVPSSRIRSWVSPSLRWWTTRWPANASTSSSRTRGVVGDQRPPVRPGRWARPGRCRARSRARCGCAAPGTTSSPPITACSRPYSRPSSRAVRRHHSSAVGVVGVEEAVLGGGLGRRRDHQEPVGCGCGRRRPRTGRRSRGGPARRRPGRCRAGAARPCRRARSRRRSSSRSRRPSGPQVAAAEDAGDARRRAGSPVVEVLDPDRVALVADGVGGVGEQPAVGADRGAAEGEEVVALRERVEVEQHLLARQRRLVGRAVLGRARGSPVVGVGDRDPAAGAVLPALEGAAVVPVAAVAGRHRQVGLAGAGLDLVEDRLRAGRPGGRCGPAV